MSIIDDLKDLHENIMDENDEFITREQYSVKLRKNYNNPNINISERKFEFLKDFLYLVLNTEIVNDDTKNLIKSHAKSVKKYVDNYNLMAEEKDQLIYDRIRNNSDNSRKRLIRYFRDDTIRMILVQNDNGVSEYEERLNNARAKYARNRKMFNNVALSIDKTSFNDNLSEAEFKELVSTLAMYTKEYMKYVSESIPRNQVGYLNYLLSACKLENENLKRFNIIKSLSDGKVNDVIEKIGQTEQEQDNAIDKIENTIEEKQIKDGISKTEVIKEGGLKSIRIQHDSSVSSVLSKDDSEDDFDIDPEDIDFGGITDADVE